ncbi:hypothetical protein D3C81_2055400 [compost metagenome]
MLSRRAIAIGKRLTQGGNRGLIRPCSAGQVVNQLGLGAVRIHQHLQLLIELGIVVPHGACQRCHLLG